jgi:hypothetical protein
MNLFLWSGAWLRCREFNDMKTKRNQPWILLAVVLTALIPAQAGGPFYVTGPASTQPGKAYRWTLSPIPYQTDQGGLGNQSNAQANALVSAAFQVWQTVSTANIAFLNSGQLGYDVTATNIGTFYNAISGTNCSDTSQPTNAIVYDLNGGIIAALGMDNNSVLGFASSICANNAAGVYTRGLAVLNGRFIDGQPNTTSHRTVSLDYFKATFIHEFGHLIGLDHSQVNLNCLTDASCAADDLAGVPTMFPVLMDLSQATPKTDDIAAISTIYPASNFIATTGRIQGRVFFSDGLTQAQGYNVIARLVGNPRRTAVSCVSGFLYTAGAGNLLVPGGNDGNIFFGSRDQTLLGYYDIAGLPPGTYTVEAEAINNSGIRPFVEGSSVGPIGAFFGFQFKMPGSCSLQYLNYPSSPSDVCSAKSTVTVGAGTIVNTHTDIILLGTPPRYDAWENGP